MIKFDQVTKRYPGSNEVLKNASFIIEAGEFVFVTGHSGAGKSTLLKLIAAIELSLIHISWAFLSYWKAAANNH